MMAKVSVIIPVYNVEKYLKQCLDSILDQSLEETELICVDDGSTDSSADILDEYAKFDRRIHIIHKENAGYGHTMNMGINAARGEYIAIVESDDWIQPMMLETLVKLADRYHLDFIKSDFCRFKERHLGEAQVEPVHLCSNPQDYGTVFCPMEKIECFFAPINTWSGIYRTEFIRKNHIRHNESPGASYQDNGFWFQTFAYAKRVMFYYQLFYMNRRDNPESSVYDRHKVYAMCGEYDFIHTVLEQMKEQKKCLWPLYTYHRYTNYFTTFKRIADCYKYEFLKKFQADFCRTTKNNEMNESYFAPEVLEELYKIAQDPKSYYFDFMKKKKKVAHVLDGSEQIIIYGAGQVGQKLYCTIKEMQYEEKVMCFAVSQPCHPASFIGIPVRCIDDIIVKDKEKIKIVIAVKTDSIYAEQMKQKLEDLEYTNYTVW